MGVDIAIENESGDVIAQVHDSASQIALLLAPYVDDPTYELLSVIDQHGNTRFDYLQALRFIGEWRTREVRAWRDDAKDLWKAILDLALRVSGAPGLYLCFYGD